MKIPIMEYARKRKAEIEASESRHGTKPSVPYSELRGMGLPDDGGVLKN